MRSPGKKPRDRMIEEALFFRPATAVPFGFFARLSAPAADLSIVAFMPHVLAWFAWQPIFLSKISAKSNALH